MVKKDDFNFVKDMWFKVLYFIYLIIALLFPVIAVVGPFSLRHLAMLVMFVLCIKKGLRWDKYMTLYTVFIFFFGLSSIITGYSGEFFGKLFGTYLQVYVFYFSTYILITKCDGERWFYFFFLTFGLLDAFVTIGQFFNLSFANRIIEFLGIELDESFMLKMERNETMEGYALHGLVGGVRNGYFLSATAVLCLYNKEGRIRLLNLLLWLFVMIASFLAQERTGFYVALSLSFVIVLCTLYQKMRLIGWLVAIALVLLALVYIPNGMEILQSGDLRYAKGVDYSTDRVYLIKHSLNYIETNLMGGYYEYLNLGNQYPHNVFISMFLVGGIFGGIVILYMFLNQLIVLIKYMLGTLKKQSFTLAFFVGMMFLAYTMNSFTHNASIVYGTFEFFIFWSALEALKEKEFIPLRK